MTDTHSGSSCSLSHRMFGPVARTDPCHKLKTQAGTYENGRHGSRAWSFWWCIALWRAEEQRSRMTCAAEGDDRIVAEDVSAQMDICTSDEFYSMKWCMGVGERLKLMQCTTISWNTTCLSTATHSGSSSLIRAEDEWSDNSRVQNSWFAVGQLQRVSKYVAQFVCEVTRLRAERPLSCDALVSCHCPGNECDNSWTAWRPEWRGVQESRLEGRYDSSSRCGTR